MTMQNQLLRYAGKTSFQELQRGITIIVLIPRHGFCLATLININSYAKYDRIPNIINQDMQEKTVFKNYKGE